MRGPVYRYYVLDADGTEIGIEDVRVWSTWFEDTFYTDVRLVARDGTDEVTVSTVFLSLNHNLFGDGPPILYETLVFGGPHDGQMARYATRAEAEAGHRAMCLRVAVRARVP